MRQLHIFFNYAKIFIGFQDQVFWVGIGVPRRARIEDEKRFPWAAQGMMPPTTLKSVADFRTA
jgi:hypothetical protein